MRKRNNLIKLKPALFSDEALHTYAILDGAAIPELWDHLYNDHAPEFACLFENTVPADVLQRAPYLVSLAQTHDFTNWLLTNWCEGWGIFVQAESAHDLAIIRRHFRSIIMVYGPNNTPLLYRYYDPYVLTGMLPQYSPQQLDATFGRVVKHFIAENERNQEYLQFSWQQNQLIQQRLILS